MSVASGAYHSSGRYRSRRVVGNCSLASLGQRMLAGKRASLHDFVGAGGGVVGQVRRGGRDYC